MSAPKPGERRPRKPLQAKLSTTTVKDIAQYDAPVPPELRPTLDALRARRKANDAR